MRTTLAKGLPIPSLPGLTPPHERLCGTFEGSRRNYYLGEI